MLICLERGADLHMAQLMPLPLTVSCFSEIQIGYTFLVPAHLGSPGKGPLNGCVYLVIYVFQDVEREISFRTESGLYYSYYKQLVNARSFYSGITVCQFFIFLNKHF